MLKDHRLILALIVTLTLIPFRFLLAETIDYTYDDLNRLHTVTSGGSTREYTYDEVGNTHLLQLLKNSYAISDR